MTLVSDNENQRYESDIALWLDSRDNLSGGCSRPCPAYPGDVAGVLPVEEQGRVLVYSNGDQEVGLYCGTVDYTGKYSIRTNCKCACDVTATMALESDTAGYILYINRFSMGPGEDLPTFCEATICLRGFLDIDYQWSWLGYSLQEGLFVAPFGDAEGRSLVLLENWTSATGLTYESAYRVEDSEAPCVLYVAVGKGILQMEFPDGGTWSL